MKKTLLFILYFWFSTLLYAQLGPEGFNNVPIPTGWLVTDNGVGPAQTWTTALTAPVCEGTRQARCTIENIGQGNTSQDWLISPQFTVPANGQLIFSGRTGAAGNQNTILKVYISTNANQNNLASFTLLQQFTEDQLSAVWNVCEDKTINFPVATLGQNVYIAFVREFTQTAPNSTPAAGDTFFIDNIKVVEQCLVPTSLSVTSITATGATLSWTPVGASDLFVVLSTAAAPTATSTPTHTNVTSPFNVTGLSPNTTYKFFVRSRCAGGVNSNWSSASSNFTTPLAPLGCGGNFVDNGGPTGNYTNNANVTTTICPNNPGEIVQVTFTSFNTEANWDKLYIYDSNVAGQNQISSGNGAGSGPCNTTGGFWGTTLPPVIVSSHPSGCVTFVFCSDSSVTNPGFIANVACIPGPACAKPTNLTVSAITQSTATVTWTDNLVPATTQWEVLLQAANLPPPANNLPINPANIVTTNSFNLTNLVNCQPLIFYVRAICANGNGNSFWAASSSFATPAS
ncbi:MAG: choice-of-anchor J domain-containing protein, partial [Flavobacterium sp.]